MQDRSIADLLRPSLGHAAPARVPFSNQAGFLVAFSGGAPAALAMGTINAVRMRRLPRDLAWLLPLLAAWLGIEAWLQATGAGRTFVHWLQAEAGRDAPNMLRHAMGLAVMGISSLMHRRERRAAQLMGQPAPNGTLLGVLLILAGWGVSLAIRNTFAP